MAKRLFVGNLPHDITERDLIEIFNQIGAVQSAKIIFDRDSGRSKGFGFVEMANDEEADAAVRQYDGGTLDRRIITVKEAKHSQGPAVSAPIARTVRW